MGRQEAQEGKVGHEVIKRDFLMRTDFHEEEDPVDDKDVIPSHPR